MSKILFASLLVAVTASAGLSQAIPHQIFAAPAAQDQKVVVRVKPPVDTITSGKPVSFDVTIDNAANLFGFQFDLKFDQKLLRSPKATESPFNRSNSWPRRNFSPLMDVHMNR